MEVGRRKRREQVFEAELVVEVQDVLIVRAQDAQEQYGAGSTNVAQDTTAWMRELEQRMEQLPRSPEATAPPARYEIF